MYKALLGRFFKKPVLEEGLPKRPLDREFWKAHDNPNAYQYEEKYKLTFGPLFKLLEQRGIKIGPVVFDIGAGTRPLSKHLIGKGKERRKVFAVDFLKPIDHRFRHIDADINAVTQPESVAYKRRLVEIASALNVDPRTDTKEQVDAFIFSDVLNYVPFKEVLSSCLGFLKRGGVVVIYNQPGKTFEFAMSDLPTAGVQSNNELYEFLAAPERSLECVILQEGEEKSKYTGEKVSLIVMRKK